MRLADEYDNPNNARSVRAGFATRPDQVETTSRILAQPGPGPVSYTHLRAHETVLDLVCRLLLETKNDKAN